MRWSRGSRQKNRGKSRFALFCPMLCLSRGGKKWRWPFFNSFMRKQITAPRAARRGEQKKPRHTGTVKQQGAWNPLFFFPFFDCLNLGPSTVKKNGNPTPRPPQTQQAFPFSMLSSRLSLGFVQKKPTALKIGTVVVFALLGSAGGYNDSRFFSPLTVAQYHPSSTV